MRTRFHGPRTEAFAKFLGRIGEWGAVWVLIGVALAVAIPDHGREFLHAGALATISIGINFAVKLAVRRKRPVIEGYPPLGGAPSSLSFPSAHTTASFAAVTAMTRIEPACAVLYLLAFAIGLGRPYLGMHYPSDVLAGIVLGVALGLVAPLQFPN
jgi:membrane-associated phospholipid phosphatase